MTGLGAPTRTGRTRSERAGASIRWTLAFAVALSAAVSRGALELAVGKTLAYGAQVLAVVVFVLLLFAAGGPRRRPGSGVAFSLAYLFLLAALLSLWASLELNGIDYAWTYVAVTLFLAVMLLAFIAFAFDAAARIAVGPVVAVVGLVLVGAAAAQQFAGWTALPGNDTGTFGSSMVRPASLTGSFLHYPIVLALLVFVLLGVYRQVRRARYLLIALVLAVAVLASLSRSGIVILAVGVLVGVVRTPGVSARLRAAGLVLIAVPALLVLFPTFPLVARVASIFDVTGAGNETRVGQWSGAFALWLDSPLLVGAHTGRFTNVTANLSGISTAVAESGVLQILVGFGLLGLITFYGLMLMTVRALRPYPVWFAAAAVAAIAQSAVYQSIEVFPFMVVFAALPLMAAAHNPPSPSL